MAEIQFGFIADGGFAARDLESGICGYAYPTSEHYRKASRGADIAIRVAREMLINERRLFWCHLNDSGRAYDARITAALSASESTVASRFSA